MTVGCGIGRAGHDRTMSDHRDEQSEAAHGVHGARRDDGKLQEEPSGTEGMDERAWAEETETGGDAS